MKKKIVFFVFLGLFFLLGTINARAEGRSCTKFRETYDVNDVQGKPIYGERITIASGTESVCGQKHHMEASGTGFKYKIWITSTVLTCNDGEWNEEDCGSNECVGDVEKMARCATEDAICDTSSTNGSYYNWDGSKKELPSSLAKNDTICINNEVKKCTVNGWVGTGTTCAGDKDCLNHWIKGRSFYGECHNKCKNPQMSDHSLYCKDDKQIYKCISSNWVITSFEDALGEKCSSNQCIQTTSGPKCADEGFCSTITIGGKEHNVIDSINGGQICFEEQIYTCNNNQYTPGNNCKNNKDEEMKYCNQYPNGTAACGPKNAPGSIEAQMTITSTSSNDFWCVEGKKIKTAIGCISIEVPDLVKEMLPTIFGIAGGIAFLMMVYGFIMMSISSGDEKKVQSAKQIITSAITGLLVAIFALFLYRLIAVQILHIPGI